MMTTASILMHPDLKKPFYLQAADITCGFYEILCENDSEGRLVHLVAFTSRSLQPKDKKFHTTDGKLLDAVYGVNKCRLYLFGQPFVTADQSALAWLLETKSLAA